MLSPKSVLITGANRGIGLEFVSSFLKLSDPPRFIFAGRFPTEPDTELVTLANSSPAVHILNLDVTDQDSVEMAKSFVEKKVQNDGLNLLINNAGVLDKSGLQEVTRAAMRKSYEVNAIGPLMMVQTFYPLLKQAASTNPDSQMSCNRAAVINISSGIGSISEHTGDRIWYPYKSSKFSRKHQYLQLMATWTPTEFSVDDDYQAYYQAKWHLEYLGPFSKTNLTAQNMITKNLSLDLREDGILCTALNPGWVRTDMGGCDAQYTPETSVQSMLAVMSGLQGEEGTGRFIQGITGKSIAW